MGDFNENRRIRYQYLKRQRRCVSCGKQDERTLGGKTRCEICAKLHKIYRGPRKYSYDSAYSHNRYEMQKAKGICVRCGKPNDRPGKIYCSVCSAAESERKSRSNYERKAKGVCVCCGKPNDRPGKSLCSRCSSAHASGKDAD